MSGRVLFLHATAERYGADRSLLLLAGGLVRRGWAVDVGLPAGPLVEDLRSVGATVHVLDVGAIRRAYSPRQWAGFVAAGLPAAAWRARRLARAADIVHLNTSIVLGGALGAVVGRKPVVWHIRESWSDSARAWRAYGRVVGAAASVVVANSEAVAAEVRAVTTTPCRVVHNGAVFADMPTRPPSAGTHLVTAGRINAGKGQEVLVDALDLLRRRGVSLPTLIAGDAFPGAEHHVDSLRSQLASCELEGDVELLGFVEDVPALLARARVFVLPSRRPEGFGLALLEAMAAGLACVATDAGGPAEIVRHGETGLLVPPGDAAALADALEQLWTDEALRSRLGAAAASDVRERFSIESTLSALERVYAEILGS